MYYPRFLALATCMILFAMALGCGNKGKQDPGRTISVDGTLSVNGKPYGPAVLSFELTSDESGPVYHAQVKEDGTFDLLSCGADDGDPRGKYRVALDADPDEMVGDGVPYVKRLTVEIQMPADGETLKLKIQMKASGGMNVGGPSTGDDDGLDLQP